MKNPWSEITNPFLDSPTLTHPQFLQKTFTDVLQSWCNYECKTFSGPTFVNEKELFHATRSTSPALIWQGEDGFDMRHSSDGMWGRGTYFASEASYSHLGYFHYNAERKMFQLFLAHVLTGDSISLPPNRNIKMPPLKRWSTIRYDSVNGVTEGCLVYILYKLDMAYPAYLINYTIGLS